MVGYARSQYEFDHSVNKSNLEGMHFGLYGSATAGAWYADAALNGTWLTMDSDIPAFGLRPEDTLVTTDIASYGLQAETGMRWKMGRLGVEPLASLSYVQTAIDDISIPADDPLRFGAEFEFENAVSSRIGAGARFSMENLLPNVVPTHVSFTAKATQELDGEVSGSIRNLGPIDAPVEDTLDGTFVEVNGAVTITNTSKSVSGYLNVDGIFGDDYESLGLSAGFRYQW
jgi:outer membrane autotransporter protein